MKPGHKTGRKWALLMVALALTCAGVTRFFFPASAQDATPALPDPAPALAATPNPAATVVAAPNLPPVIQLSQAASEIAKLAQGGVDEQVMLSYIGTVNGKFNLGSDQIIYLNDLGVSGNVVKAMIQRDAALDAAAMAASPPPPAPVLPPAPPPDDASAPPPMVDTSTNPPVDPGTPDDADYFYNSLSPYGAWVIIPGFGLCWQPTVVLGNHDWEPYADRGRWIYSDCGWYWQSDYSWGWAPFHYGRWFNDSRRGWVWQPDHVWGAAWVSWRHSADYCGWAPLPPAAKYKPGLGFVYANHPVNGAFDFGLRASQYTFIPLARLTDYAPARYAVPAAQAQAVYAQSKVINQVSLKNNRVILPGINPQEVAAASQTEVRRAEIQETAGVANRAFQTEHLTNQGNHLFIIRPSLPAPVQHTVGAGTSLRNQRSALPIYLNGNSASATQPAEVYPRGSLVVIGPKNVNDHSAPVAYYASANTPDTAFTPNRPVAGFNFNPVFTETAAPEINSGNSSSAHEAVVIAGRYSVAQRLAPAAPAAQVSEYYHAVRPTQPARETPQVESHAAAPYSQPAVVVSHSSSSSSGSAASSFRPALTTVARFCFSFLLCKRACFGTICLVGISLEQFKQMKSRVGGAGRKPMPAAATVLRRAASGHQIVLGVDPSLRGTGYGVIRCAKPYPQTLAHGTIVCPAAWEHSRCLLKISESLRDLIQQHHPTICIIEGLFFAQNLQTALTMGEARGAAMAAIAAGGLEIFEIAPRKVKQAIVGYGAAQKIAVARMVQRLLHLAELPAADAADALALALTHAQEHGRYSLIPPKKI